MKKIFTLCFLLYFLGLITLAFAIHVDGVSLYFYTGEKFNGNVTIIPVENAANKTISNFSNSQWSVDFDMIVTDVEYLTFIIDDNQRIGFTQVKLDNDNPKKITQCSIQNISMSGYAVDSNTGNPINSGNIRVSVLNSDFTKTTSFSGEWNIDFNPCLISGKIYTLHILISDNTGKTGEIFQNYPAR